MERVSSENDVWDKIERVENRLRDKLKTIEKRLEQVETIGTCRKCDTFAALLDQSIYKEKEGAVKLKKMENLERDYSEKLARVDFFRHEADRKVEELEHRLLEAADVNLLAAERKKNQKAQQEIVKLKAELTNSEAEHPSGGSQFRASNGAGATVFTRDNATNEMLDFTVIAACQSLHADDIAREIAMKLERMYGGAWDVLLFPTAPRFSVRPKDFYLIFFLHRFYFLINGSL